MDLLTGVLNRLDHMDIAGDEAGCSEPAASPVSEVHDQAGMMQPMIQAAKQPVPSFQSPENGYGANWSG